MEYDIAGNQKKLIDPSAGTINYTYNGYGELVTQQNARSQTTTIIYNPDGTIKRKETPEGLIKYRYNPTNKQLVNVNSYGTVSHTYSYDSKGRVISVIDTIPGTSPLTTTCSYDSYSRVSTITHPSGITETYNYNVNGYLSSISAGGSTRWTNTSMNSRGQLTAGQYGSDLIATYGFDVYGYPASTVTGSLQSYSYNFNNVTGNLNWRQNNKYSNLKETFNYDNSDRLDNVYLGTGTPVLTLDMAYDSNKGGITTKSDAGTMFYNTSGKPYRLSGISPTTGLVPSNTQSITYTSFESVSTISENNYVASFTYNPEAQRAKMIVQQSGNTILTRWYSGSSYVKETAGGVTKQYTYIGGDAYTAPVVAIKTGTGTPVYYYLLRDYLGSITHVVNTSKTLVAEYSYDAWGRMRNPTNWTNYAPGTEPSLFVAGRGFTGHEHMPWFNSINMNGRIYDPLIGQFLSPDNYVQSPDFTQNFNRYTYCLNNPLKFADSSGETYKAYMDEIYGEGNYWHRGKAPGTWGGGGGSFGGGSGGSGGSGSYGSGVITVNDINSLWDSKYGGYWSPSTGKVFYKNEDQAYFATCDYIDSYGYWGGTEAKSYSDAYSRYILLQSKDFYTASLDGGPAETYSLSANAPKQDFSGFWGGLKYFFTGGYVGGYSYNIKGEVIGLAPITGIAPTPYKGNINPNFLTQLEKQLAKDGINSIYKTYRSLQKNLLEHQEKLNDILIKSSVEREIRTWQRDLRTIEEFLKRLGL